MEIKVRNILDGDYNKLLVSQEGKQSKIVMGKTTEMSVIGAQKCVEEVRELLNSRYSVETLLKMQKLIEEQKEIGRNILKYSGKSVELALKIQYPEQYQRQQMEENLNVAGLIEPLTVLNTGCTSTGKTVFDLKSILSEAGCKNFLPSLTSMKESTNFSIFYHINNPKLQLQDGNDFKLCIHIKSEDVLKKNIDMQILEAVMELYSSIKEQAKEEGKSIDEIRQAAQKAAVDRLGTNCDKTFVIGYMTDLKKMGTVVENILIKGIREYYGQSTSYHKMSDEEIYESLIKDIREKRKSLVSDDISNIVYRKTEGKTDEYREIYSYIRRSISDVIEKFTNDFKKLELGNSLEIEGNSEKSEARELVDHIFGNKRRQNKDHFYSIESIIESAEIFFESGQLHVGREVILVDGLGINQGQAAKGMEMEVAYNRINESIQMINPDIILYHSQVNGKDDYMLEVIRKLSELGFRDKIHVIFGRIDTAAAEYFEQDELYLEEVTEKKFEEFLEYIRTQYLERDIVTLKSIIGEDKFHLCDKLGTLQKKMQIKEVKKYSGNEILKKIIAQEILVKKGHSVNEYRKNFFSIMERNFVFGKTYIEFLRRLETMIPMKYEMMRWNTLEKALDELFAGRWGFYSLYPSLVMKDCFAGQLNDGKVKTELQQCLGNDFDEVMRRLMQEWTNVAHIVLVIQYRSIMKRLLRMRYDSELRTMTGFSMTDERKINLKSLYSSCLQKEGADGTETLNILTQVAWKWEFVEKNII